jgi:uncharacterized protein
LTQQAFTAHGDHVRVTVRLTPNGGRDGIDGVESGADGQDHLKVRVRAIPEKGKASASPRTAFPSSQAKRSAKKSSGSTPTRRMF